MPFPIFRDFNRARLTFACASSMRKMYDKQKLPEKYLGGEFSSIGTSKN